MYDLIIVSAQSITVTFPDFAFLNNKSNFAHKDNLETLLEPLASIYFVV